MITEPLLRNLDAMHPSPHPLLVELEERSAREGGPAASRPAGRFLSTIVTAMQANRILEVGTGFGYATLWMAMAQPRAGKIWTISSDGQLTDVARSYFRRAGKEASIEAFTTPPLQLLENFPQRNLDVAFVTATEEEALSYLGLVVPMLKLSGLAIFNDALAMRGFARRFLAHPALDATLLPLGIGIGARRR